MKKKLGTVIGIASALFILTSCGGSPQDEFIKQMESQQTQKEGTYDFKFAIKELELPEDPDMAGNPMVSMMVTQLKDISIDGTMKAKDEGMTFAMDMKVKALGMEVPFNMIGDFSKEPKMYLATDMMEYIMGIASSMIGQDISGETDYSKLKGKYIDVFAMDETMDQATFKEAMKEMESAQKNQNNVNKKVIEYMKGLDKKSFTKKDNVISHTLTKEEFAEILKIAAKETEADLEGMDPAEIFKEFDKFSAKIDINTKEDKTSVTLDMAPKPEDAQEAGIKSMTLLFETTMTDKKADIKMPKKEDILSAEEMEAMFPEAGGASLMATELSDEDYEELKAALVEGKDDIDAEMAEELLAAYEGMLTEAQYKEIEKILKK